ncbi:GntR family transcriptional regulator [Roseivivax sp.]
MADTKSESHAARITRELAQRIVSGRLAAGARLRQDHIALEFSTSHVPVREAFRRLEAQGLVESEPRRGVRVAAFGAEEIREVAQMRASLEVLALRNAAPHLTPAILDEAEEATGAGDCAGDVYGWEAENRRFHRAILTPCGMPRLLRTIDDLHLASARILFARWSADWETPTDRDHRAILVALRAGNIDRAAALLAQHVGKTEAQARPQALRAPAR